MHHLRVAEHVEAIVDLRALCLQEEFGLGVVFDPPREGPETGRPIWVPEIADSRFQLESEHKRVEKTCLLLAKAKVAHPVEALLEYGVLVGVHYPGEGVSAN
jgi:hypothetical protein